MTGAEDYLAARLDDTEYAEAYNLTSLGVTPTVYVLELSDDGYDYYIEAVYAAKEDAEQDGQALVDSVKDEDEWVNFYLVSEAPFRFASETPTL